MATYNVERTKHATLVANVVDTVNINTQEVLVLEVTDRSPTTDVYFTINPNGGSTAPVPTVEGDETFVAAAAGLPPRRIQPGWQITQVKLIASAAAAYSVEEF